MKSRVPHKRKVLMRKRCKTKRKLKATTSLPARKKLEKKLQEIEQNLKSSHINERRMSEKRVIENIKVNSKFFLSYAKQYSKTIDGVGPLLDSAKKIITGAKSICELLRQQYESVFSKPRKATENQDNPNKFFSKGKSKLADIAFTTDGIKSAINELSVNAASGPDGLPAILLKNGKDILTFPIYILWRDSLDTGNIPELLKLANIVPIHKGGSKAFAKNYRPISLTSHLIKIFERVIRKHIVKYLETNNLLNQGQHGFRTGRSCLTQLKDHYDRVLHQCETGANVDVIYLDFAKAFNKVDHNIPLSKIKNMAIGGRVGIWLYAFLKNRYHVIVTNKSMLEKSNVISGVPQGTVLGPALFLIIISDIDTDIRTIVVSSFADDTRVSKKIGSPDDTEVLQQDLNKIYVWTFQYCEVSQSKRKHNLLHLNEFLTKAF